MKTIARCPLMRLIGKGHAAFIAAMWFHLVVLSCPGMPWCGAVPGLAVLIKLFSTAQLAAVIYSLNICIEIKRSHSRMNAVGYSRASRKVQDGRI